jgi:hypothetical protein
VAGRLQVFREMIEAAYRAPRGPDGDSHSLLGNLETVPPDLWGALPDGGARSIAAIVLHVGSCKYMYDDYAFRSATLRWDAPPAWPANAATMPPQEMLAWMDEGHRLLAGSIACLDERAIDELRLTNWGERWPTRRIIRVMIEHDLYHAGEVNHLRSILQRSDRWAYDAG